MTRMGNKDDFPHLIHIQLYDLDKKVTPQFRLELAHRFESLLSTLKWETKRASL